MLLLIRGNPKINWRQSAKKTSELATRRSVENMIGYFQGKVVATDIAVLNKCGYEVLS